MQTLNTEVEINETAQPLHSSDPNTPPTQQPSMISKKLLIFTLIMMGAVLALLFFGNTFQKAPTQSKPAQSTSPTPTTQTATYSTLAYKSGSALFLKDETGTKKIAFDAPISSFAWSNSGTKLALILSKELTVTRESDNYSQQVTLGASLQIYDLADESLTEIISDVFPSEAVSMDSNYSHQALHDVSFSPDNTEIAVAQNGLLLINLGANSRRQVITDVPLNNENSEEYKNVVNVDWNPKNNMILVKYGQWESYGFEVFDPSTNQAQAIDSGDNGGGDNTFWSADGEKVFFYTASVRGVPGLWVSGLTDTPARLITSGTENDTYLFHAVSTDSEGKMYTLLYIWPLVTSELNGVKQGLHVVDETGNVTLLKELPITQEDYPTLAVTDDSRFAAYTIGEHAEPAELQILDLESLEVIDRIPAVSDYAWAPVK